MRFLFTLKFMLNIIAKPGGPRGLKLHGKILISLEKLYNLCGAWAPWPLVPMPMLPSIPGLVGFCYQIVGKFGGGKLGSFPSSTW